jgi:hypothetical protein
MFNAGLINQSIVQPEKVNVDFRKVRWIGSVSPEYLVCYGFAANGVKTWDDMMSRKGVRSRRNRPRTANYITGAALNYKTILRAPIKEILGFPGSAERRIAIERGELDGDCSSVDIIPVNGFRMARAMSSFGSRRSCRRVYPTAHTFAKTQEQKELLDLLNASDEIGRPFIASRQVPEDRIAPLRRAFGETMRDKPFVAHMLKQRLQVCH